MNPMTKNSDNNLTFDDGSYSNLIDKLPQTINPNSRNFNPHLTQGPNYFSQKYSNIPIKG